MISSICRRFQFAALFLLTTVCFAQDIVSLAPKNAKVEYEDARIRVARLKLAPHESLPMHDRPARVVICLTRNNVRLAAPDGTAHTLDVAAGNIGWSGPARRSVENLDTPLENVIVEIKNAPEAAKPVTHAPDNDPRALIEPDHHWLFENQYVRVYDVHDPPQHAGEFHKHAYDSIIVKLSGGPIAEQLAGQRWSKANKLEDGKVSYSADYAHPRTHRVRNEGSSEYHAVVVQLLR